MKLLSYFPPLSYSRYQGFWSRRQTWSLITPAFSSDAVTFGFLPSSRIQPSPNIHKHHDHPCTPRTTARPNQSSLTASNIRRPSSDRHRSGQVWKPKNKESPQRGISRSWSKLILWLWSWPHHPGIPICYLVPLPKSTEDHSPLRVRTKADPFSVSDSAGVS